MELTIGSKTLYMRSNAVYLNGNVCSAGCERNQTDTGVSGTGLGLGLDLINASSLLFIIQSSPTPPQLSPGSFRREW